MSLLLEALKKAERDKLGEKEQTVRIQDNTVVKDKTTASVSNYTPSEELELVPEKTPSPSSTPEDEPKQQTERESTQNRIAAQNLFSAKQDKKKGIGIGRLNKWVIYSGILLVIVIAASYYVWQETTITSEITPLTDGLKLDSVQQRSTPSQVASDTKVSDAPENLAVAPVTQISESSERVDEKKISAPLSKSDDTSTETIDTPLSAPSVNSEQPTSSSKSDEREYLTDRANINSSTTEQPINIQRSPSSNEVSPQLTAAYQAYVAGDLAIAKQFYLKALDSDSTNKDVLLGLAAIATRMRQDNEAQSYYLRVLELDPRDPFAVAGIAALGQTADLNQTESRLKTLLAQQPDAAALHFTLGNNYVSQSRWTEAQQSFFRAFSIDSTNADYAFNLAVSLDHLNKIKLASKYYSKALVLAGDTTVGFEKAQASKRLKELSQ